MAAGMEAEAAMKGCTGGRRQAARRGSGDRRRQPWPIDVFGFVAARDSLDCKHNFIFNHESGDAQTLTAEKETAIDIRR
ncbi:hypothetical protein E2562_014342 [Oryza meyeriana var. granulata]|uniref:DUF6598 domain-containing protein n=1 Tax=Oryza meyeriana var. granulata TaxID=110450 RepID=A0A6G1C6E8_9ORYZ|nr:hypothetical protein E2562_014342 [Oryza meyeriana var. granulata]